jgi:hypothetical protein
VAKLSVEEMMKAGRRAQRTQELAVGALLVAAGLGWRFALEWIAAVGWAAAGLGAFMLLHAVTSRGTRA